MNPPDVTKILQQTKDESLDEKKWDEEFSNKMNPQDVNKDSSTKDKKPKVFLNFTQDK